MRTIPLFLAIALAITLAITLAIGLTCATSLAAPAPGVLLQARTDNDAITRPDFSAANFTARRYRMVRAQIASRDVSDTATLDAMRAVPRHRFVPDGQERFAYFDRPVPIGHGQTISQPYIVGKMTELLDVDENSRVLEVGTGSAYQAAILGMIVREVVSIEIIEPLARTAASRLQDMAFENITVLHGDGYYGYEARAPYDAIIVTAAATHVPPPLIRQLKPGGRMVIPVGRTALTQNLLLVHKNADGEITTRNLFAVRFVPLTGDH